MAKLFYITLHELEAEKDALVKEFTELKTKIINVETDIVKMKNNLNALSGAVQQCDKLIKTATEHGKNDDWVNDFYKQHVKEKKKKK